MKNRILFCLLLISSVLFMACPSPRMYYSVFLTDNVQEFYSLLLKEDLKCSIRIERNISNQYFYSLLRLNEDTLNKTRIYVADLVFCFYNASDNDINVKIDNLECFGFYNKKIRYKGSVLTETTEFNILPKSEYIYKIIVKFESSLHRYFIIKKILLNNISILVNDEKTEVSDLTFVKKHEKMKLH